MTKFDNTHIDKIIILSVCLIMGFAVFSYVRYITQNKSMPSAVSNSESELHDKYPIHRNIIATVFWVGEDGNESNDFIQNRSSFWMDDWLSAYGGVDSPDDRCGNKPCEFEPKENPFYFALPYADTTKNGPKPVAELQRIPWYDGTLPESGTLLKNRWVKIDKDGKTAYAQWEDVGPFGEDDINYVFGTARPQEARAGIDLSPAVASYLSIDGRASVSWQFVDDADVQSGPWKEIITTSPPKYE